MNHPTNQESSKDAIEKKRAEFHAQASAKAKAVGSAPPLEAGLFQCAACEATLSATLISAIGVAIALTPLELAAAPSLAAIALSTGLSNETVRNIIVGGAGSATSVVSSLCKAMGACD